MIPCEQRETIIEINKDLKELNKKVAEQGIVGTFSHEQIETLFEDLKGIKSAVDQNMGMAKARDQRLDAIMLKMEETKSTLDDVTQESDNYRTRMEQSVKTLQKTVDNGLNKRVTEVTLATEANTKALQQVQLCLEERKKRSEREKVGQTTGWHKFWYLVRVSFDDFIRKYAALVLVLWGIGMFYFFLWVITKADVFGEKPVKGFLKLLFGG